jgi:signal transduction histidine kinase
MATVSSRTLFTELFSLARRDVESAGLTFVAEGTLPDRSVYADSGALAQVVDNIIQNAKRYAPDRGTISARVVEAADTLEVSIADTGAGIPPEDLPHVFELFYRGDPARTPRRGEAGLGLAICKRLVERHGGTIRAENRGGAVITFTLPLT